MTGSAGAVSTIPGPTGKDPLVESCHVYYLPLALYLIVFIDTSGPTGPTETCEEVRNCFKFGPGPCGCKGDRPVPCLATVGPNMGQAVCGPQCGPYQQLSEDCTSCISTGISVPPPIQCTGATPIPCFATIGPYAGQLVCGPQCALPKQLSQDCTACVDTCNTHPYPPAILCGPKQVQCLASSGPNLGKTVCAPKCPPSQQSSADCTRCVVTVSAPSASPALIVGAPSTHSAPTTDKSAGKSTGKGPAGVGGPGGGAASTNGINGGKTRSLRQAEIDVMML